MAPERPRNQGPQTEDGFVQIALELAGAIALAGFTDREMAVLTWVLAQTYGPRKHEIATASMTELESITGFERKNLAHAVRSLESRNVLRRAGRTALEFNKHYETWTSKRPDRMTAFGRALIDTFGFPQRRKTRNASTEVGGQSRPQKGVDSDPVEGVDSDPQKGSIPTPTIRAPLEPL